MKRSDRKKKGGTHLAAAQLGFEKCHVRTGRRHARYSDPASKSRFEERRRCCSTQNGFSTLSWKTILDSVQVFYRCMQTKGKARPVQRGLRSGWGAFHLPSKLEFRAGNDVTFNSTTFQLLEKHEPVTATCLQVSCCTTLSARLI